MHEFWKLCKYRRYILKMIFLNILFSITLVFIYIEWVSGSTVTGKNNKHTNTFTVFNKPLSPNFNGNTIRFLYCVRKYYL